jgi:ElaA protein
MPVLHRVSLVRDLDPITLYRLLQLRVDVFVVEQRAAYAELDGRDIEPEARLAWVENDGGEILATLRILHEGPDDGERRIGRVATRASARGQGHAATLLRRAVDDCGGLAIHLDAQAHLEEWYARFGFVRSGPDFVEDEIPHLPMTRPVV